MIVRVARWNGSGLRRVCESYVVVLGDVGVSFDHRLTCSENENKCVRGTRINRLDNDTMDMYVRMIDDCTSVVALTCDRAPREEGMLSPL